MKRFLGFFVSFACLAHACLAEDVEFNRDILPILSDRCFHCHGPDEHTREGGVRFDTEQSAKGEGDSGEFAIVAGDVDASELFRRITSDDEFEQMPPPDSRKEPLDADQIELVRRWIRQGAEYQTHWAYVPPSRPASAAESDPPSATIDRLVRDRLREEGLEPAAQADPRTLLRRVSFDLTGLPPTQAQMDAFLADPSESAFEAVVDRLLASPAYGERMAMWWLDLVRYADTVGYHGDQDHRTWPYRDWVIEAFNDNKPFDEFTVQQIAGDLMANPTEAELIATAYNRLLQTSHEGGAQLKEYRAIYQADRIRNFSQVWMGATVGCAQCHTHKYDPYTIDDFYKLGAFFADVDDEEHLRNQYGGLNSLPTRRSPELTVQLGPATDLIRKLETDLVTNRRQLDEVVANLDGRLPALESALVAELESDREATKVWLDDKHDSGGATRGDWRFGTAPDHPVKSGTRSRVQSGKGTTQHYFHKSSRGFATGNAGELFSWVYLDPANPPTAVMLQFNIDGSWSRRAVWGSDDIDFGRREESHIGYLRQGDLPETGTWVRLSVDAADLELQPGTVIDGIAFTQFAGKAYWDAAGFEGRCFAGEATRKALETPASERTESQQKILRDVLIARDEAAKPFLAKIEQLELALTEAKKSLPRVVYTKALAEPRVVRVLPRGNWLDETGEIVEPAIPAFLGEIRSRGRRADRLDLARWLVTPHAEGGVGESVARVQSNRFWHLLTGVGISSILDDFGGQGEPPTHPELLDELALQFHDSGWDVKAMLKTIVMTRTYRQSSLSTKELRDTDPENRLFAVQSRNRLPAEMIRDNALAVSGLLQREIGGPSVKPYQPAGYYSHLNFPARRYTADQNQRQWRRGLYVHWQRQFLHPMLKAFDAPTREECTAQRSTSNTPTAALVLLNDPTFVEAARVFAGRILAQDDDDDARLEWAFRESLNRSVTPAEKEILLELLANHRDHFGNRSEEAAKVTAIGLADSPARLVGDPAGTIELAAWTSVARAILNLNELITRN